MSKRIERTTEITSPPAALDWSATFETRDEENIYPDSDGKPMAETDTHRDQMIDLLNQLIEYYRDRPDVYVTGNLFFYYQEGAPEAVVAPDVMVVQGVQNRKRRTYRLWEEKQPPTVVIELTSISTKYQDLYKKGLYEELGVKEYYLFDPLGDYLPEPFIGYHLVKDRFVEVKPRRSDGHLPSRALGLDLVVVEEQLRLYDAKTGQLLPTYGELEAARQQAEAEREREAQARRQLEEELKRLRAQLKGSSSPSRRSTRRK
jgi:Uma2 family endonuclease